MIGTDVSVAASLLEQGKLVGIPTETVYGLGANALDPEAVLSIFKAKNRPSFDPLIVHISDVEWISELTTSFPEKAQLLAKAFWPGPLTLILPKSNRIPDVVTSGLPFVGIRMPRHPLTQKLLSEIDFPLAAPSANPFSYVSPTTAQHVEDQLGDRINYVLDGGPCKVGIESTIVSFEIPTEPRILRFGGLDPQRIEDLIGPIKEDVSTNSNPTAPGQLDKHYATKKSILLLDSLDELRQYDPRSYYIIGYGKPDIPLSYNLSEKTDSNEMASKLFSALRLADQASQQTIVVCRVPDTGLGRAINDRLQRAQA